MSLAIPPTPVKPLPNPALADNGADLLRQMGHMGLFQPGVPVSLGGHGGQLRDLYADAEAAHTVTALRPHATQVFRAQRLAIEAFLLSQNVALREFIVPDLVLTHQAGTAVLDGSVLKGQDVGNGLQLNGNFNGVANMVWSGFSLVVSAQLEGDSPGWLMLRSEEDGLYTTPGENKAAWRGDGRRHVEASVPSPRRMAGQRCHHAATASSGCRTQPLVRGCPRNAPSPVSLL